MEPLPVYEMSLGQNILRLLCHLILFDTKDVKPQFVPLPEKKTFQLSDFDFPNSIISVE